ncbi:MAG: hypothetical protein AB7P52_11620 [Alphaproteobacteria bacterium]
MITLYPIMVALALAALLVGLSRFRHRGLLGLGLLALMIPAAYFAATLGLSRPKPMHWSFLKEEAEVLGAAFDRGKAIFLWVRAEDAVEPRYYTIKWDERTAEALQDALKEAEENGSSVMMGWPSEPSLDLRDSPMFHALPPPALPPKPPAEEPNRYERPEI